MDHTGSSFLPASVLNACNGRRLHERDSGLWSIWWYFAGTMSWNGYNGKVESIVEEQNSLTGRRRTRRLRCRCGDSDDFSIRIFFRRSPDCLLFNDSRRCFNLDKLSEKETVIWSSWRKIADARILFKIVLHSFQFLVHWFGDLLQSRFGAFSYGFRPRLHESEDLIRWRHWCRQRRSRFDQCLSTEGKEQTWLPHSIAYLWLRTVARFSFEVEKCVNDKTIHCLLCFFTEPK